MHKTNKLDGLILCGGRGFRLNTLGKKSPKSLLKFNNTTILDKLLKKLIENDIKHIKLSCYYKYEHFVNYLRKRKYKGNILCENDGNISILDRIKINLAKSNNDLLVCYADEIANINIKKLYKDHLNSKKLLTITTYKFVSNFGFLFKDKNKYNFVEKPYIGNYNIGYYIFSRKALKYINNTKKIQNFINKICIIDQIHEFQHKGKHLTYNTIDEYNKVKNMKI